MTSGPQKPNLFIVGAMKCGTTAWYEYLRSHPDIFMPDLKEPGFFAFDLPKWRDARSEEEYAALFAEAGPARLIGDASPIYLMSKSAAQAIRDYNPAARILIFLRDQEEYLPSLHNLNRLEFAENISDFETAWRLSGRRPQETIPAGVEPSVLDYVEMGRFHGQVTRYLNAFGASQVRVFWYREWVADPRSTYLEILRFLELKDDGRSEFPIVNRGVRFRTHWLVRSLYDPPASARKIARLIKRVTGMRRETQNKLVEKTAKLLQTPGYTKIGPRLADEIRRYYAADNKLLKESLQRASSSTPLESRSNLDLGKSAGSTC